MAQQSMIYLADKSESFLSKVLDFIFRLIGAQNILVKRLTYLDKFKNELDEISKSLTQTFEKQRIHLAKEYSGHFLLKVANLKR